ncbi:hypothetical protein K488DRAFT_81641 [Vararia minispora EC-137]|uniref:Uncharacterized protein n=1 Tax=Vararia minispora EC-137 TaxID=1314806 RepID=A0ACB8QYI9_9AGAM|nr:hypothetical protein K488DRAFT_81641 [Vararia minispora EC-137]
MARVKRILTDTQQQRLPLPHVTPPDKDKSALSSLVSPPVHSHSAFFHFDWVSTPEQMARQLDADNASPSQSAPAAAGPSNPQAQKDSHIPRPMNSYFFFRREMALRAKLFKDPKVANMTQADASRCYGFIWKNLPADERAKYDRMAAMAKSMHQQLYPHYKFRPRTKAQKAAEAEEVQRAKDEEKARKKEEKARERQAKQDLLRLGPPLAPGASLDQELYLPDDPMAYSPPMSLANSPVASPVTLSDDADVPPVALSVAVPLPRHSAVGSFTIPHSRAVSVSSQSSQSSQTSFSETIWKSDLLPVQAIEGPATLTFPQPPELPQPDGALADFNDPSMFFPDFDVNGPPPASIDVLCGPMDTAYPQPGTDLFLESLGVTAQDELMRVLSEVFNETTVLAPGPLAVGDAQNGHVYPDQSAVSVGDWAQSSTASVGDFVQGSSNGSSLDLGLPASDVSSTQYGQYQTPGHILDRLYSSTGLCTPSPVVDPLQDITAVPQYDYNGYGYEMLTPEQLDVDAMALQPTRDRMDSVATITPAIYADEQPAAPLSQFSFSAEFDSLVNPAAFVSEAATSRSSSNGSEWHSARSSSGSQPFGTQGSTTHTVAVEQAGDSQPYRPPAGAARVGQRRAGGNWRNLRSYEDFSSGSPR